MTTQETFDSLSQPIRHFIRNKGWADLRPIQKAAIEHIMFSDKHCILASRTASGKTEAAFLPILSKADFSTKGVQILYISPLVALINDQMIRVEELCRYLNIPVVKWHGEANKRAKRGLIEDPYGIVLITPESIEAMFINHPKNIENLFGNLQYLIIDEIHYFIGTDRGKQLESLISRIQNKAQQPFQIIGLSATIGDFELAKKITGDPGRTVVISDLTKKPMNVDFRFYASEDEMELPIDLVKDIFRETYNSKSLIFPNSRGRVEEVAVKLQKLAELTNCQTPFFAHHSSLTRATREDVEFYAKRSENDPFAISCTSTLELGIDIGSLDKIIQVDATYSVSSLIQRAGRCGRRDDQKGTLFVFSTKDWELLQALACWNLHEAGKLEPPEKVEKPYGIFVHQLLSIVRERGEISPADVVTQLLSMPVFSQITPLESKEIIEHLLSADSQVLELQNGNLIIGIGGERIVNSHLFYTVFTNDKDLDVLFENKKIGELQPDNNTYIGAGIFLAAKIWTIVEIDWIRRKIYVSKADEGKKPKYSSDTGNVSEMVEQEMLHILYSKDTYSFLNEAAQECLYDLRTEFSKKTHSNIFPVVSDSGGYVIYPLRGTKINRSISLLLEAILPNTEPLYNKILIHSSCPISQIFQEANNMKDNVIERMLTEHLVNHEIDINKYSKYGYLLPLKYQVKVLLQKAYDITAAKTVISLFLKNEDV